MTQLYYPSLSGGANSCSLIEAQVNFIQFGACERTMIKNTRPASEEDFFDPLWFPLWSKRIALPDRDITNSQTQNKISFEKLCYWLHPI